MAIANNLIAKCYLNGESAVYIFYDTVTLDILRFEIKGNTKCKLSLIFGETDLKEEFFASGKKEQGNDIQIIETKQQWKMRQVIENEIKKIKLPSHIKVRATWEIK